MMLVICPHDRQKTVNESREKKHLQALQHVRHSVRHVGSFNRITLARPLCCIQPSRRAVWLGVWFCPSRRGGHLEPTPTMH